MTEDLKLDGFMPHQLGSDAISQAVAGVFERRLGISSPDWRVLVVLGNNPDSAAMEVAARTRLDKVAVSRAVTKLVASGLVDRDRADIDRRRAVLNLTRKGRSRLRELERLALDLQARLTENMPPDDVAALSRLLEELDGLASDFAKDL
jgi:DNA-binding MarR family transcriptional regulator